MPASRPMETLGFYEMAVGSACGKGRFQSFQNRHFRPISDITALLTWQLGRFLTIVGMRSVNYLI